MYTAVTTFQNVFCSNLKILFKPNYRPTFIQFWSLRTVSLFKILSLSFKAHWRKTKGMKVSKCDRVFLTGLKKTGEEFGENCTSCRLKGHKNKLKYN